MMLQSTHVSVALQQSVTLTKSIFSNNKFYIRVMIETSQRKVFSVRGTCYILPTRSNSTCCYVLNDFPFSFGNSLCFQLNNFSLATGTFSRLGAVGKWVAVGQRRATLLMSSQ